jgi:hypothetical protein
MTIYGVASDDSHDMTTYPPGKGWIQVAADSLTPESICDALRQGRFYASTGVEIQSITMERDAIRLKLTPGDYETVFSGVDGVELMSASGSNPAYRPRGGEVYVRATVTSRDGGMAWTQPVYID